MISELSFLLDLLLNHKLPKPTKDLIAKRIGEVEANLSTVPIRPAAQVHSGPPQAASTLALMAKHGELPPVSVPQAAPEPVAVIAHTPATAAAMQARSESIAAALSGRVDKNTGQPRKW